MATTNFVNGTVVQPEWLNEIDALTYEAPAFNILRLIPVAEWSAILAGTSTYDATAEFATAQTLAKDIYVPAGRYVLNGLRIQNNVRIRGAGLYSTHFVQKLAGTPAINCLSDITVGQLRSVELLDFNVIGAASATVAAVLVAAYGAYAVYESKFRFNAENTYSALEIQGNDGANVFMSEFFVYSVGTTGPAVLAHGGVYNKFDMFLVQCQGYAIDSTQNSSYFERVAVEGPIRESGQNNTYQCPTIEHFPNFIGTMTNPFYDNGFNNTWFKPKLVASASDVAKVTSACFRSFFGTTIEDPQFLFTSATKITNPIEATPYKLVIQGPGRSECTNKIETLFDGTDSSKDIRNLTLIGLDASLTSRPQEGSKAIQYLAPAAPFNFPINVATEAVVWEPTGTLAFVNLSVLGGLSFADGQVLSFSSTQTVTTINWFAGIDCTRCPATIAANTSFSIIYRAANNAFYRA